MGLLYYGRMIWLLPHHLPPLPSASGAPPPPPAPSPVSKLSLFLSLHVCRPPSLLTGDGGWGRSQIVRPRESLGLYKLFNNLCCKLANCLVKERLNTKYKYLYIMEIVTRSPYRDVVIKHFKHESAVNLGEGKRGGWHQATTCTSKCLMTTSEDIRGNYLITFWFLSLVWARRRLMVSQAFFDSSWNHIYSVADPDLGSVTFRDSRIWLLFERTWILISTLKDVQRTRNAWKLHLNCLFPHEKFTFNRQYRLTFKQYWDF
jgi:hypothetical protein